MSPHGGDEGDDSDDGDDDGEGVDVYDNTIDAIVEFFWFQSSIDRGTDFYVAVIKTRVTPGHDCYYAPWDWARGAQTYAPVSHSAANSQEKTSSG